MVALGIKDFASAELDKAADETHWIELGQVGRALEILQAASIRHLMMAGRVPHNSIFQYRHFDARALKLIARAANRKADSLLGAVTAELEREGIEVMDSSMFLKSLMPLPGLLTPERPPSATEQEDIDFGWPIAKAVAGQDIGQSIVVKGKAVIAVEAMEGTDECIRRAGQVAGPGCVVIKVSKPAQDLRFDIPIIGKTTLKHMVEAGCTALAFSARESLLFDHDQVLQAARENNISILARE